MEKVWRFDILSDQGSFTELSDGYFRRRWECWPWFLAAPNLYQVQQGEMEGQKELVAYPCSYTSAPPPFLPLPPSRLLWNRLIGYCPQGPAHQLRIISVVALQTCPVHQTCPITRGCRGIVTYEPNTLVLCHLSSPHVGEIPTWQDLQAFWPLCSPGTMQWRQNKGDNLAHCPWTIYLIRERTGNLFGSNMTHI